MATQKKNKVQHNHICRDCKKPATINLQNSWHKYYITDVGDFTEVDSWEGESNEFFCEKHYEKEMSITN